MWKKVVIGLVVLVTIGLAAYVWLVAPVQRYQDPAETTPAQPGGWRCVTSLPTQRSELGTAVLDGRIYVAGGMNRWGRSAAFEVYEPVPNACRQLAAFPLALNHLLGIAAAKGRIYVAGGYRDLFLSQSVSDAWAYEPTANAWTRIAALPGPRAAHVMVSLDEKLFVVGGVGSDSSALWVYDPATNTWDTTRARMPTEREHAAVAVVAGKLYVISRRRGMAENFAAVEVYDPLTNTWTRKRDIPMARGGLTAAVLDGLIHVTGEGFHPNRTFNQYDLYDPVTDTWSALASLPTARHGLGSAVVDERWYVIGGASRPGFVTPISATAFVDAFSP